MEDESIGRAIVNRALGRIRTELDIDVEALQDEQRVGLIQRFDDWLADEGVPKRKLDIVIDLTKPGPAIVEDILSSSYRRKMGGVIAYHLVGAKLARRFPRKEIENYAAVPQDQRLRREADYLVGDAAFHVSIAVTSGHLQRCAENLMRGRRPYMIVPASEVEKARAYAEDEKILGRVAIVAIESFVGLNIVEMGEFRRDKVKAEIAGLLHEYNRRVAEVEADQSVQISISEHCPAPDLPNEGPPD